MNSFLVLKIINYLLQIINRTNFGHLLENNGEDNCPTIIYSCYIVEDELLFILFTNGLIITYDTVNDSLHNHSLDSIDHNDVIDDAQFSHDQELLVINTHNNLMLLYNKLLVLKRRYDLNIDEYGANEMINVNWGSKATQFHGQGMRDHRMVVEQQSKTTVPLTEWDDHKCFIDWKHDDDYYTINFLSSKGLIFNSNKYL